jgi:hypothetical protein
MSPEDAVALLAGNDPSAVQSAMNTLNAQEQARRATVSALLRNTVGAPGTAAQPVMSQTPGMWSDEDEARRLATEASAAKWGPQQALSMIGTGTPISGAGALGSGGGRLTMTNVPDIRGMPAKEAIKIAREEPHLIPTAGGGYVGGPPGVKTYKDLKKLRESFEKYVSQNPEGGDWYDRYRNAIKEVTGNEAVANRWMANQQAQWSAGVSPESELQFALRENNAALAGSPVKSARPAQHEAHLAAIEAQDPSLYMLGQKTGEYARKINPDQPTPAGATGVNDFRYARQWGYPTVSGQTNVGGVGIGQGAAHRFMDYETALAVDRANKANLGGRSDWTGEQLQANPWITQKAGDLMKQRGISFPEAYAEAKKQIGDFFNKHTAFETYEAQPGSETGHLPLSVGANPAERAAFALDPRSNWATAPGGRDAIYGDLRIPGTGVAMRVRPTQEMQGAYTTPAGVLETNPGAVARPLVSFQSGPVKNIPEQERALMDASAATRGYIDAQNFAGWHKPWEGGQLGGSQSIFMPNQGPVDAPMMRALSGATGKYGLPDIVDTGQGLTATNFGGEFQKLSPKARQQMVTDVVNATGGSLKDVRPVNVNLGGVDYVPSWQAPQGTGTATQNLLNYVTKTPEIREAFNNNMYIPHQALMKLERDKEWASKWGATRDDIQNARRIISEGPGWIDRLEAGMKNGAVLPSVAAAVLGTGAHFFGQKEPAEKQKQ